MKSKVQRITISLPDYLYVRLKKQVPERGVSQFIVKAVADKLPITEVVEDPIEAFLAMREKLPAMTDKELKKAVSRGRA